MDTLNGIIEHVEADFGDSIISRDAAILRLSQQPALGPPDLCWLQKSSKGTLTGTLSDPEGYYHHVLGRDVSNSAAVAAYFALLMSQVEQASFVQGLLLSKTWTIQRGFYCCYDVIARTDVRCELCIPGGVVAGSVDATGLVHEVTPTTWKQLQVSAFLRAVYTDPEMRVSVPNLVQYDTLPTEGAEASLTAAVTSLYQEGVLPAALEDLARAQGYGTLPLHMDLVLYGLWTYWVRNQRWDAATQFFTTLSRTYPPAAVYVAAAAEEQGDLDACCELLTLALERSPTSLPLLLALASQLLNQQQLEAGVQLVRRALKLNPHARPAWLLLARCCLLQRCYASALIVVNVMPSAPMPQPDLQQLQLQDLPAPARVMTPQALPHDAEVAAVRQCAKEAESPAGNRLLAYLHGAVLVRPEPLGSTPWPDTTPERLPKTVLGAVYGLLQDMVDVLGWEAFLQVRSGVFLMHQEPPATPRTTPLPRAGSQEQLSRPGSSLQATPTRGHAGAVSWLLSMSAGGAAGGGVLRSPMTARALAAAAAAAAAGGVVGGGATALGTGVMVGGPVQGSPHVPGPVTPGAAAAAAAGAGEGPGSARVGLPPMPHHHFPVQQLQQQHSTPASGGQPIHKRMSSGDSMSYMTGPEIVAAEEDQATGSFGPLSSATPALAAAATGVPRQGSSTAEGGSSSSRSSQQRQGVLAVGGRGGRSSSSKEGGQSPTSYYASRLQKQRQQGWASPAAGTSAVATAPSSSQSSPGDAARAAAAAAAGRGSDAAGVGAAGAADMHANAAAGKPLPLTVTAAAAVAAAAGGVAAVQQQPGSSSSPQLPPSNSLQASLLWLSQQHPRTRQRSNGSSYSSGSTPGTRPAAAIGEVEDLTRWTSASLIAGLTERSGITPALWDQVFGPRQEPGAKTRHLAANSSVSTRLDRVAAISVDPVPAAGADPMVVPHTLQGLPRIRTRPLAEGVEGGEGPPSGSDGSQLQAPACSPCCCSEALAAPAAAAPRCSEQQQQQQQQHWQRRRGDRPFSSRMWSLLGVSNGCWGRISPTGDPAAADAAPAASSCTTCAAAAGASAVGVSSSSGHALGEGLEPTSSLLMRGHSIGSTPGSATPRGVLASWGSVLATLPPEHSTHHQQQQGPAAGAVAQQGQAVPVPGSHRRQLSLSSAGGRAPHGSNSGGGAPAAPGLCSREADQVALIAGHLAAIDLEGDAVDAVRACSTAAADGAAGQVGDGLTSSSWGQLEDRRLCVRWLDELIIALWHDLQLFYDWRVLDSELLHSRGGTHAELVLGLVEVDEATQSHDGGPPVPRLPAADWLRRGALAERLRRVTQARHAYRASVKLGFSLSAYLALLRLESELGEVADVLLCANTVAKWHVEEAERQGQPLSSQPVLAIVEALGMLLQRVPVNEVKAAAVAANSHAWVLGVLANWNRTH